MARIDGTWTPETDADMSFIVSLNRLVQTANQEGVAREDIASGLSFMAATVSESEDLDAATDTEPSDVAAVAPSKTESCPQCDSDIDDVLLSMGGIAQVRPCGCRASVDALDGYGEVSDS